MGIDFEKMKKKLNRAQGKSESGVSWWKPKQNAGMTKIRFLPDEDGDPFKEIGMHYSIGAEGKQKHFACPSDTFGDDCPVCEYAWKLFEQGKEAGDEQMQTEAKKLLPSQRFMSNVLAREQEELGAQIYSYSYTVYESLLKMVLHDDIGDITDVDNGFDVEIDCTKGPKDRYPSTDAQAARSSSSLHPDDDRAAKILEDAPDIMDELYVPEKEEIEELLEAHLSDNLVEEPDEESEGTEKYSGDEETSEKEDIDAAFESLDSK